MINILNTIESNNHIKQNVVNFTLSNDTAIIFNNVNLKVHILKRQYVN